MKMDIKKLKGEDLYLYVTELHTDKEFVEMVELMAYALMYDMDKVYSTLEDVVQEDKKLVALYPGNGDVAPQGAKLIGAIPDGVLYVI